MEDQAEDSPLAGPCQCSVHEGQVTGKQARALSGAVLTSGQLGEDLCPRIRVDYWLEVSMSAKSDSQLEYASHISVLSGQGTCLF